MAGHVPSGGVPMPQESGYASIVLERLARHACRVLGVASSCVVALERPRAGALLVAGHGIAAELIGSRVELEAGIPGLPVSAPVSLRGSLRGAVAVAAPAGRADLAPRERALLGEIAELVAMALEHHERRELVEARPHAEVGALVRALERSDGRTYRHSDHVAALARAVGEELGLGGADLLELELGALLHDVGKVRVAPGALNKRGALDPAERKLMRLHPVWGAEIVARIPGLEAVALVVRFHHERVDGSGYPDGLPGDRIPLASRIVAVCDAYGAMTSDRPYRAALAPPVALGELEAQSGTQFDGRVVAALVRVAGEFGGARPG